MHPGPGPIPVPRPPFVTCEVNGDAAPRPRTSGNGQTDGTHARHASNHVYRYINALTNYCKYDFQCTKLWPHKITVQLRGNVISTTHASEVIVTCERPPLAGTCAREYPRELVYYARGPGASAHSASASKCIPGHHSTHTHTRTRTRTRTHTRTHAHTHAHTHMHTHNTHARAHTHARTCMHASMYTFTPTCSHVLPGGCGGSSDDGDEHGGPRGPVCCVGWLHGRCSYSTCTTGSVHTRYLQPETMFWCKNKQFKCAPRCQGAVLML